jgi:hypothetical protein
VGPDQISITMKSPFDDQQLERHEVPGPGDRDDKSRQYRRRHGFRDDHILDAAAGEQEVCHDRRSTRAGEADGAEAAGWSAASTGITGSGWQGRRACRRARLRGDAGVVAAQPLAQHALAELAQVERRANPVRRSFSGGT